MNNYSSMSLKNSHVFLLGIVFVAAFFLFFKPWIYGYDPVGYYSWLRSIVIDQDINTTNEFEYFEQDKVGGGIVAKTGYRNNPYAIGSAVLWAPFFLIAHIITLLGQAVGMSSLSVASGYSFQYVFAVSLGTAVYAWIGLLLTYKIARDLVLPEVALLAVITVWLASPLVFYQFSHPAMSHGNDAFAYALFLFVWYRTRTNRTILQYGLLGLSAGLCALVRNQNAILVVFPLAEIAYDFVACYKRTKSLKLTCFRTAFFQAVVFSVGWWLVFSLQLLVWRTVFGVWLPGNPYEASQGGNFSFFQPNIFGVLLSTNRGLFSWTPVTLLAVVGWWFLFGKDKKFTLLIVVNFIFHIYVISSWSMWSGAAAFGQRFLTNMVPALILGFSALMAELNKYIALKRLAVMCALFVVWNGLLLVRYALEDIPRLGYVSVNELVLGQFTVVPRYFDRIIQILITRQ